MFSRHLCSFVLLTLTSLAAAVPAAAQEKLAWKFAPGTSLKYVVNQNMNTEITLAGQKTTQAIKQTMDMGWSVQDVSAAGVAVMGQTIERIQMDFSGSLIEPFKYDSGDSNPPATSMARRIADSYSKILNQQFQVTMKPTGEITNVKVPDTLMEALTSSGNGVLTEDMVKQMMTQSAITLKDTPVSRGQVWQNNQTVSLPYGKMSISSTLTYAGVDSTGRAVIRIEPKISIENSENSAQQVKLNSSTGKGSVYFDNARGVIVRSELDLMMDISVQLNGQAIDQKVTQKLAMTLAE
ncbi:MAG: hypothetical protein RLZZ458_1686 [Planctomycetota bacterium]